MVRLSTNSIAIMLIGLAAICVVIAAGAPFGMISEWAGPQQQSWEPIVEKVRTELSRGLDDEALETIRPLLAENHKHDEIARISIELGEALSERGNREAAE